MSTINFAVIILAVVGVFFFRRIALRQDQRQDQPAQIRLRKLWAQLWLCVAFLVIYLVAEGIMFSKSQGKPPVWSLAVLVVFVWMLIRIILKIRGCQKEGHKP